MERYKAQNELLVQAYRKIHATLAELRKTQDKLIASEKLAALGHLIAGVGHEINSPLGAIGAAQTIIHTSNKALHDQAFRLGRLLNDQELERFDKLIEYILLKESPTFSHDASELERRYLDKFTKDGVDTPDNEQVASLLASLDLDVEIEEFYPLITHTEAVTILTYCRQFQVLETSCSIIEDSAARAQKIVQTLKNYAYDSKGEKEEIVLSESLDAVLMLHESQLLDMELVRAYEEVPIVKGDPDKVAQIWVNLITNAVDAANGQGMLEVGIIQTDENILVYIQDQAGGMPPEVEQKLFDPFFTTKPKGKGTGLGLSIVKRIAEEQGAQIEFHIEQNKGTRATVKFKKNENHRPTRD